MTALEKAAQAAWERYSSTVRLGGTPKERQWAYDQAAKADEKVRLLEFEKAKREAEKAA